MFRTALKISSWKKLERKKNTKVGPVKARFTFQLDSHDENDINNIDNTSNSKQKKIKTLHIQFVQ
jgi:hypothetical protein